MEVVSHLLNIRWEVYRKMSLERKGAHRVASQKQYIAISWTPRIAQKLRPLLSL